MTSFLFLILLLLSGCAATAPAPAIVESPDIPDASVATSLFLIGDAGSPAEDGEPVLVALSRMASRHPDRSVILFLGDNVYPAGIPDSTSLAFPEAARRLNAQIEAVRSAGCRGIFIPGNHDWAHHGDDGWNAIRRQGVLVDGASERLGLLPSGGCPGPEIVDLQGLRLVLLDTQWWLHQGPKPSGPDSGCDAATPGEVTAALESALSGAGGRAVIVAGHHPLLSGGEHGGHFTWMDHLFPLRVAAPWLWVPLPVVGSLYPAARNLGYSRQDMSAAANRRMRDAIETTMAETPPLAYVSGHEHTLQVLRGRSASWYLVSGSGRFGHGTHVASIDATEFASSDAGFMRVDVLRGGGAVLNVYAVRGNGDAVLHYTGHLAGKPAPPVENRSGGAGRRSLEAAPHMMPGYARIHYHDPRERYDTVFLEASASGNPGPAAPSGRDYFGPYWNIPLDGASSLRFTIRREGVADPRPDMDLDISAHGSEVWVVSGSDEIHGTAPDIAASVPGDLTKKTAFWITRNLIAWDVPPSDRCIFLLSAAADGGLRVEARGITGADTELLTPVSDGLPPDLAERFPELRHHHLLRLPDQAGAAMERRLKGQLAISVIGRDGRVQDASGIDISGVLEEVTLGGAEGGVTWEDGIPTIAFPAPEARAARVLLFESIADTEPVEIAAMTEIHGVWRVAGAASWAGRYCEFEADVFDSASGRIETRRRPAPGAGKAGRASVGSP